MSGRQKHARQRQSETEITDQVRAIWNRAHFIRFVGYKLERIAAGECESSLKLRTDHLQQNNYVHAGVLATMADHTAGAAGGSLVGSNEIVLSIEFKINMLRPAVGDALRCEAKVLHEGKSIIVVESWVYTQKHIPKTGAIREKLAAKATVTLAVVNG
ncbi:MAG: PaaI family thioesterase [Leptospiraceae bacterium]|nr:PaaI family thioesterase [Leptospiraceae bacterium]